MRAIADPAKKCCMRRFAALAFSLPIAFVGALIACSSSSSDPGGAVPTDGGPVEGGNTLDGTVPTNRAIQKLGDDEIVERLTEVRGIGRWTVEMLLIFQLGRPDVLPVDDFGVRNGFRIAYRRRSMPTPTQVFQYGERWKPYRTVAAWYLWRAVDLEKQAKQVL